ncbi:MAG: hypothetical protein HKM05_09635 [Spirochaetales bacterium]|nr:hypothetical protein [Spirochaetales bacterium]
MRRLFVLAMMLVLAQGAMALSLWGAEINGLEVGTGLLWIRNTVENSAPDPICNTFEVSVPFRIQNFWIFRPEAQMFFQTYGYQNGRAIPVESMFDSVSMMGLLLNPTFGAEWRLSPYLRTYAEGGIGLLFRLPVFLNGTTAGSMAGPITAWFAGGRFLYPNLGGGLSWQFSPLLALMLRGQVFYPLFNLWDQLPWDDELTIGASVGVRFTF